METDLKYCKKDQLIPRVFLSRNKMFLLLFDMVAIIILSNQDGDAIFLDAMHFKISSIYEHKRKWSTRTNLYCLIPLFVFLRHSIPKEV